MFSLAKENVIGNYSTRRSYFSVLVEGDPVRGRYQSWAWMKLFMESFLVVCGDVRKVTYSNCANTQRANWIRRGLGKVKMLILNAFRQQIGSYTTNINRAVHKYEAHQITYSNYTKIRGVFGFHVQLITYTCRVKIGRFIKFF